MNTCFFWFRRDLRLNDNTGLIAALRSHQNVQPLFIFDTNILAKLEKNDSRVTFIWQSLKKIDEELKSFNSSLLVKIGDPITIWKELIQENPTSAVYHNSDYEPYALERDKNVRFLLESNGIEYRTYKDHVFFEKDEILKADGTPYTVYTPYKRKWLEKYSKTNIAIPKKEPELNAFYAKANYEFPELAAIGFEKSEIAAPDYQLKYVEQYDLYRDYPGKEHTTEIGHHLRFGTISIRSLIYFSRSKNQTFLSELIWREFFSQILGHFPHVIEQPFKTKYSQIPWDNNPELFEKWCKGETGYPLVDAGMRQLNQTGFMHNRVRMITASFLVKHLLIDWRWGEAYFAKHLLDFDLASNNGNWQWAAGTGCDAAPYFRVFNPTTQQEKFDKDLIYIKKWIPGFDPQTYIKPIIEHKFGRERAIKTYKEALAEFAS